MKRARNMDKGLPKVELWWSGAQLRAAFEIGSIRSVQMLANGGSFRIEAETVKGERVRLRKAHDAEVLRNFQDPISALALLYRIGIKNVEVDLYSWCPTYVSSFAVTRPDVAERLRYGYAKAKSNPGGSGLPKDDLSG